MTRLTWFGLLFVYLRLTGKIDWHWNLVILPLYVELFFMGVNATLRAHAKIAAEQKDAEVLRILRGLDPKNDK